MIPNDLEYYRSRAAEERARALATDDEKVAAIHAKLARKYDELAEAAQRGPTLRIGWNNLSAI